MTPRQHHYCDCRCVRRSPTQQRLTWNMQVSGERRRRKAHHCAEDNVFAVLKMAHNFSQTCTYSLKKYPPSRHIEPDHTRLIHRPFQAV